MKKLAILAAIAFAPAAAFACPNSDHDNSSSTVKKEDAPKAEKATAKAAPKADKKDSKDSKDSKDQKDDSAKKPDKVSSK